MIGSVIEHYKIISILGEGGMGIVYKAFDIKLERYVALKILTEKSLKNPQFIERFKREAKNQAKLTHPNIVPVYGFTEMNNLLGIVMEYVHGETLEHMIARKGRLELPEALSVIKQVLVAASYAHSKGFIHRDLKPSNIIINEDGTAKIMDFGISKSLNEAAGITKTGTKLGTVLYMSPEQIKAKEPTPQSDIYSIGITLYECLLGETPFKGPTDFHIMEEHIKKNPTKLSTQLDYIPPLIDSIIGKALSKTTQKRYHTCEEFYADLNSVPLAPYKSRKTKKHKTREFKRNGRDLSYKIKAYLLSALIVLIFAGLFYVVYSTVSDFWTGSKKDNKTVSKNGSTYRSNPSYLVKTSWNTESSPTTDNLTSVFFLDDSLGFACGDSSTILRTKNGGKYWTKLNVKNYGKNLNNISFFDRKVGIAAGDNGLILKTVNGGESWGIIKTGIQEALFGIYLFPGTGTGFLAGGNGTILRTTDGGGSWKGMLSPSHNLLYSITFIDSKTGFAVGWNGEFLKTADSGISWTEQNKFSNTYLKDISFANDKIGIAVGGGGGIYRTEDGGTGWKQVSSKIITGLYSADFLDPQNGIILGSKGEILVTRDSGITWEITASGKFGALTNIAVLPSKKVIIVGYNGAIITSQG